MALKAPKLLVVAASARALTGLARRSGLAAQYRIVAVDAFADLDTRRLADAAARFEGGLSADDVSVIAACHTVADPARDGDRVLIGGGLEPLWPALLPRLADLGTLVGPAPRHAAMLADPEGLAESLAGLPIPLPSRRVGRVPGRGRWIVKPALRAGGTKVRLGEAGEVLPPGWFAEPYLKGGTVSVCALAAGAEVTLLGAARHLAASEMPPCARQALAVHPDPTVFGLAPSRARAVAAEVARRLGYTGIFGLDVVCSPEVGPMLVDVNLRPPASLEWMQDAAAAVATLIVPDMPPVAVAPRPAWRGGAVVTASGAFRLDAAAAGTLAEWAHGSDQAPGWVHDLPAAGQRFAAGAPVCTVSALAEDEATLRQMLAARSRKVGAVLSGRPCDSDRA